MRISNSFLSTDLDSLDFVQLLVRDFGGFGKTD